uniref:Uncharacterized protein n=1 Tax=Avena sativa TaxID=4498 RepID=A0ACD5VKA0_AVESA
MVAVRRLPGSYWLSFQFRELKDQLVLAAKLKHSNIVPLLGICLDQREKLLVHEYLPNPSLHTILLAIFNKQRHLDWENRRSIIRGIASGLLYLHQDSGLRINYKGVLRASKILVDDDMNPKILDAGIPPPNTDGRCVAMPDNIWYGTSGTKDQ